jgi:hypothetical protein
MQIHCSSVQHSLGCSLEHEWLTLVVSACTPQPRMHCFVHCRFTAAQCSTVLVQPGRGGYGIGISACTRLNPRTCIALSTDSLQLSAAQSLVQPGRGGYDARCLHVHTPRSTHMHALSTGFTAVVATQSRVRPERECYDARCFSMHTPQSTHMHCFVLQIHCSPVQAPQSWCGLEHEWHDARCFAAHCLNRHALLFHCRFHCSSVTTQSWCSLERSGYDARCFSMHASIHALLCPADSLQLSCSTVLVQPGA